jgi:hypothetical protein
LEFTYSGSEAAINPIIRLFFEGADPSRPDNPVLDRQPCFWRSVNPLTWRWLMKNAVSNERQIIDIKVEVAADFSDLFEVKDAPSQKGEYYRCMRAERLVLADEIRQLQTCTLIDIAALRSYPELIPRCRVSIPFAAGIPWEKTRVVAEQPSAPTHNQIRNRMMEQRPGIKAERAT